MLEEYTENENIKSEQKMASVLFRCEYTAEVFFTGRNTRTGKKPD